MSNSPTDKITDRCIACGRSGYDLPIFKTAFGVRKTIGKPWAPEPNPDYKEYLMCNTDILLYYKFRKTEPGLAAFQYVEFVQRFREAHPLTANYIEVIESQID